MSKCGGQKGGNKRLTYTHFSHPLDDIVGAMSDDNQVVGPRIRIWRAKTAVGT
jgi:hypothetical protein